MALERLRDWARTQFPIAGPEIAHIQISGVVDDFGTTHLAGQIDFPMLERASVRSGYVVELRTEVSSDLLPLEVVVLPGDLTLRGHQPELSCLDILPVQPPPIQELEFAVLPEYPAILDLFEALAFQGAAGRAYEKPDSASSEDREGSERTQVLDRTICRHGLPRYACATCAEEAERRKQGVRGRGRRRRTRRSRTLNVFELLLPYLQPPLEPWLAEPTLFPASLRPYDYQIQGIIFLAEHNVALLGDEMGLGKTIQTIVALQLLFRRGRIRSVLILCKRSLLGTWEKELRKWALELRLVKIRGTQEERDWLWSCPASVYLTTYDTLRQDINRQVPITDKFDVVVLDEVQEIKNPTTGKSRAIRKVHAKYRWGLSGTPLENKIEDVASIFDYLEPTLFQQRYRDKSFTYNPSEWLTPENVQRKIRPYLLRRRLRDVKPELPEKVVDEIWLDLTDAQRASYEQAYSRAREQLRRPGATRIHVFALLNELKQICNIDPQTGESCKLEYLTDQLESIVESDRKALVFSHFPKVTLSRLIGSLEPYAPELFDGTLTDAKREELIHLFQEEDDPKVLLMSVKAGGVGLTLTRANHVFHFDHWWNPAVARQAEGRAHRIGQEETVFVFDLYTADTIEERIHRLLEDKQRLFDEVVDNLSADYVQGQFTDEELFALFDLSPPGTSQRESQTPGPESPSLATAPTLADVGPREFEELVADLYARMGFRTELTPQSRDGGVDVIARRRSDVGEDHLIIQCKHYPDGTAGEQVVRDLVGALQEHRQATHAVLVTSGRFSAGAVRLAERHRITLVDGVDLRRRLREHGLLE